MCRACFIREDEDWVEDCTKGLLSDYQEAKVSIDRLESEALRYAKVHSGMWDKYHKQLVQVRKKFNRIFNKMEEL